MSLAPEQFPGQLAGQSSDGIDAVRCPTPVDEADVIEIGTPATAWARAAHSMAYRVEDDGDMVILGGVVRRRPTAYRADRSAAGPIVDQRELHNLLVSRRERYVSAPPPPRARRRGWLLSSLVIAGGGVAAVLAANGGGETSLVAMVALISTVLCGALLVAAQVTEEIRRARHPSRAWPRAWQ